MENPTHDRLHAVHFGLAWGFAIALYFLFIGCAAAWTGWGKDLMTLVGSWYPGAGPSFAGAIWAAIWGFVDGFIGGFLIAFFYNKLQAKK